MKKPKREFSDGAMLLKLVSGAHKLVRCWFYDKQITAEDMKKQLQEKILSIEIQMEEVLPSPAVDSGLHTIVSDKIKDLHERIDSLLNQWPGTSKFIHECVDEAYRRGSVE